MSIESLLSQPHIRRTFFLAVSLVAAVIVGIRYFVLPLIDPSLKVALVPFISRTAESLLMSLLVAVFVGSFLFWITPRVVRVASIEAIEPRALPALFEKAMQVSDFWYYKGSCGRYFRTRTLPVMAYWARNQSISREIVAIILDPRDQAVCETYAEYRNSTRSVDVDGRWDAKRVRREIYATALTVLHYQAHEKMLRVSLGFSRAFSSFRIDLSSLYVIVTKEDRLAPAMKCDKESFFYQSYRDEVYLSQRQGESMLQPAVDTFLDTLSVQGARDAIQAAGLACAILDERDYEEIVRICLERKNPYEHGFISEGDSISLEEIRSLLEYASTAWGSLSTIWHSLGFVHATLWSNDQLSLRLHIWPAGVRSEGEQQWKIHDHVYAFSSMVILGSITDTIVSVSVAGNSTHQIYEVEYGAEESVLHRTSSSVSTEYGRSRFMRKGETYSLPRKMFHFTSASAGQLTATIMATYNIDVNDTARVLGDLSGPPLIRRPIVRRTPPVESLIGPLLEAISEE